MTGKRKVRLKMRLKEREGEKEQVNLTKIDAGEHIIMLCRL